MEIYKPMSSKELSQRKLEDYSKMAVAILINDEAVAYANYQDVYNKTHAKESVSKEELLRLREILQDNKEKKVLVQDSEVERRIK